MIKNNVKENLFDDEEKEFLRKASELLKKHQWEMICRHYIEGMTHREIAAEMGVSHQYVTKGIKKGLHRIRCTYT